MNLPEKKEVRLSKEERNEYNKLLRLAEDAYTAREVKIYRDKILNLLDKVEEIK